MAFVNPLFLYGLAALAIPLLVHLFNFRRYKKVWFTNVRQLAGIRQETRKRSRIRQWVLLVLRMLAITFLVLAFARPYIPSPLQQRKQTARDGISVYIDNSFSMDAVGREGNLLEMAQAKAKEIAAAFRPSDKFQLITNDFEARHQRFVSRDELLRLVGEVAVSPVSRPVSEVIARQQDLLKELPGLNKSIFLISDFQQSTSDFSNCEPDTTICFYLMQLTANSRNNLFIDTLWFTTPAQQPEQVSSLHIRIRNTGSNRVEKIPVKLVLNQEQKAMASAEADAGSDAELTLSFTNEPEGIQSGYVEITDYPVVQDDRCYLSFPVISSIQILCINDDKENPYLNALYGSDSLFRFTNAFLDRLQYARFSQFDLIILNHLKEIPTGLSRELLQYVAGNGHLVIIPSKEAKQDSYLGLIRSAGLPVPSGIDTLRLRVNGISVESQVYRDVFDRTGSGKVEIPEDTDFPLVLRHFILPHRGDPQIEPILLLQNGDPFLVTIPYEKGRVYLMASPLETTWTNFPTHLLFAPTFYKIALLSRSPSKLYYCTVSETPIELRGDSVHDQVIYKISNPATGFEMIPGIRQTGTRILLFPHGLIRDAGLYLLSANGVPVTPLAFNYSRLESDLRIADLAGIIDILARKHLKTSAVLKEQSPSVTREITDLRKGTSLWKLCIILVLGCLAAEILVIRFLKDAP